MNQETLKGKWGQLKGDAEVWWGKTTGDPITEAHGNWTKLTGWLQEKKGIAQEDADKEVKEFLAAKQAMETRLDDVKAGIQTKWNKLTNEDVADLKGGFKELSNKIGQKYNQKENEVMADIKTFMNQFKDN